MHDENLITVFRLIPGSKKNKHLAYVISNGPGLLSGLYKHEYLSFRSSGKINQSSSKDNDFSLGVKPKKQSKAPADLGTPPVAKRRSHGVALPALIS